MSFPDRQHFTLLSQLSGESCVTELLKTYAWFPADFALLPFPFADHA